MAVALAVAAVRLTQGLLLAAVAVAVAVPIMVLVAGVGVERKALTYRVERVEQAHLPLVVPVLVVVLLAASWQGLAVPVVTVLLAAMALPVTSRLVPVVLVGQQVVQSSG